MPSTPVVVNPLSITFMCVTLLICFGGPIALAIWAKVKYKRAFSFIPLLAGVLGFLFSQIVFRIPVISYLLPMFGWYRDLMAMTWPAIIFLSFTAGLVEEPARFIAFSIMKKRRAYPDGLSYGIGHGGFEAMVITGLSFVNNLIIAVMMNTGTIGTLGGQIPQSALDAMVNTPPYLFLQSGVERIFAVALHTALSLFVLKGFQVNKRWLYLLGSILLHGFANLLAVGTAQLTGSSEVSEVLLLIVAVLSVLYIVRQARAWRRGLAAPSVETLAEAKAE